MPDLLYRYTNDPVILEGSNPAVVSEHAMTVENWIDLKCHPSTVSQTVHSVQVLVFRPASAELRMTFRVDGDIPRTRFAPPGVPRFATQLWQHTCFEAFIAAEGQPAYHEFNFAPSREWAVYAFRDYRDGGPLANEMLRPDIAVRISNTRLELDAVVYLDFLAPLQRRATLRIGLSAIIEANEGLSYWALHHPARTPDFHDASGFTVLLEPTAPNS
jgi:hypothetical protein